MTKQIVVIHGGSAFETDKDYLSFLKFLKVDLDRYRKIGWKDTLREELGNRFDVLLLKMPNPMNSKYAEWKMLFRKIARLLDDNVVLIGHSLGGVFLAKYLSENKFPKKIRASILIAPPYDEKDIEEPLGDFVILNNLKKFKGQGGKIFIYHSEDDPVVPYLDLGKYQKDLPDATVRIFKDRGHFNQPEFPELAREIKGICGK
ncbi:alpha/beta fold hydrolase [Patescibacteria group bacterium]|nr:alpha/beta fold hydrolase [Patescibacteria group bacterium]